MNSIVGILPMVQTIQASEITLRQLKQSLGLEYNQSDDFFPEWSSSEGELSLAEKDTLNRAKANFTTLMDDPPVLENTAKMVVLAPLIDLAGFYQKPFRIQTESSIEVVLENEGVVVRGRIDVLVLQSRVWLLVIESKRSDFAVSRAIPQALADMLANPKSNESSFGLITNGMDFVFLKAVRYDSSPHQQSDDQDCAEYGSSRLFSLLNPGNDLYSVLQVLKKMG